MSGQGEQAIAAAKRLYQRWNEGGDIDGDAPDVLTEDAVWEDQAELPGATVCEGRQAIVGYWNELIETIGRFEIDLRASEALGDWALMEFFIRGSGASSGIPVEMEIFHLVEARDGKVSHIRAFFERDAALAAAKED